MADEAVVNGVATTDLEKDQTVENEGKTTKLGDDDEKLRLVRESEENHETIKLLMDEIEGLKKDRVETKKRFDERLDEMQNESEEDKRALAAISSRAADLEIEVSRLQQDFSETAVEAEETKKELSEVKEELEKARGLSLEKEEKIEGLEKAVKKSREEAAENEKRVSELEKEKEEKETENNSLEEALRKSEAKIKELEAKIGELESKLLGYEEKEVEVEAFEAKIGELERLVLELQENKLGNGEEVVYRETETESKGLKGLKWPAALASTGTVAVAAVAVYVGYARRR